MKNNKIWIIVAIVIIICIGIGIYFIFKNNTPQNSNYTASKTSINESQNNSSKENIISNESKSDNVNIQNSTTSMTNNEESQNKTENSSINGVEQEKEEFSSINETEQKKEEEISSFSTKIYTKDSARQNNVSITCSSLNGTIIKNGTTFSFCNTLGPSTSAKGYQEADIFDQDGNKKKGLGGGNCQVSTTLYNAVLKVTGLAITERHEHSNKVPYISSGKDAAVAYGSYDLKFKNNTGFDIKISASATENNVSVKLYKINF